MGTFGTLGNYLDELHKLDCSQLSSVIGLQHVSSFADLHILILCLFLVDWASLEISTHSDNNT